MGQQYPKLFITYRSEDTAPDAGRLYDRLVTHFGEEQVFVDVDQIEPGEDFVEAINRKVGACDIAMVSIGPNWLGATDASGKRRLDDREDFVRMEIVAAFERKIRVIRVLVGGARMPRKQDLPEALAPLSRRNAIELSETRFHSEVSRLIEAIEKPRAFLEKKTESSPVPVALVTEPAPPVKLADPENLPKTSALRPPGEQDAPLKARLGKRKIVLAAGLLALLVGGSWLQRQVAGQRNKEQRLAPAQPAKEEEERENEDSLKAIAAATKAQPYENSLGMTFVPVAGTGVLFSVWETRVKDFEAFVEQTNRKWPKPSFPQTPEHPAVNVSWKDATAFCQWLTRRERKARRISAQQSYRLPSDWEWSAAVGLKGESGITPEARDINVKGVYPWGTTWPPPEGAGNYGSSVKVDDFGQTSPAGNFPANGNGIYDLGGNAWEWCEDWSNAEKNSRVLRGGSWQHDKPANLLSSSRDFLSPRRSFDITGFRCVLVVES
jgi:hypothetical protein